MENNSRQLSLQELFKSNNENVYSVPVYHRPYVWTVGEVKSLFNDLLDSYFQDTNLYLGDLTLNIDETNKNSLEIVDGVQRLTSLVIIISSLAQHFDGAKRAYIQKHLWTSKDYTGNKPETPKFRLGNSDQEFFFKYIQTGHLEELRSLNGPKYIKTDAQKLMRENTLWIMDSIEDHFQGDQDELFKFFRHLIRSCIFTGRDAVTGLCIEQYKSINSRHIDLLEGDILKAEFMGRLEGETLESCSERWEDLESSLGRSDFNELIKYIAMIEFDSKDHEVLRVFRNKILNKSGLTAWIDTDLQSYRAAFKAVKTRNFTPVRPCRRLKEDIDYYLWILDQVRDKEWIPVAIKFLSSYRDDPAKLLLSLKKLERLVSFLHITEKNEDLRREKLSTGRLHKKV